MAAKRRLIRQLFGSVALSLWAVTSHAQSPLSAIDWLRQTPTATLNASPFIGTSEAPVSQGVTTPEVQVTPLEEAGRDAVGLLPSAVTGLPDSLWQESTAPRLVRALESLQVENLPAMQALLYTLLLAEANPPLSAGSQDLMLLARIDMLIDLGAIEQANALLERAGADTPALFKRWFDVTLLIGQEDRACAALEGQPALAPSYAARIFCLARAGDWGAAVVTLETANLLGLLTEEEDALLLRFLDPDLFIEEPILVAANDISPLSFRLYETIGETQSTAGLPRAYAHADLRATAGWKAQLEAAERLAQVGALPANRLLGIYSERAPAASGMIWDRVAAIQAFDAALRSDNKTEIARHLPNAWAAMQDAELEVPFARLYGTKLMEIGLTGVAAELARQIALLSPDYEAAARLGPRDFLAGLAQGDPPRQGTTSQQQAIANAFHGAGVPQSLSHKLSRGQLGEVILDAMALFAKGAGGDLPALTQSLATFRAVGLEDTARQAALQVLLLDRRL